MDVVVPAADLTTAGMFPITVVNASPGGGTSNILTFTVNNPAPTLTSISPTGVLVGSPDTTITLIGTGFVGTSTAEFNGTPIATTYHSATDLTAVVPAADLTSVSMDSITVVNAAPGGGTSGAQTFTVSPLPLAPTLTSISPNSATVGDPDTTITLSGTNFVGNSTADFNGTPIATAFDSPTELTAVIPAADLTSASVDSITVVTPAPGGGTSAAQTFTVNPAPVANSAIVVSGSSLVVDFTGPDSGTYSLDNGIPVAFSGATSFTFNGVSGSSSTLTIHNDSGGVLDLPGGFLYNGASGGADVFNVDAGGSIVRTAPGAAVLGADPLTISYANVSTINLDNAGAVNAIAGPDTADRATAFVGLTAQERYVQALYLDELGARR